MLKISFYALLVAGICSTAFTSKPVPPAGCSIYGTLKEKNTSDAVPFASLCLYRNDSLIGKTNSDMNGEYCFKQLAAGKYKLKAAYVGYQSQEVKGIAYSGKDPLKVDVSLSPTAPKLDEVTILEEKAGKAKMRMDKKQAAPATSYHV